MATSRSNPPAEYQFQHIKLDKERDYSQDELANRIKVDKFLCFFITQLNSANDVLSQRIDDTSISKLERISENVFSKLKSITEKQVIKGKDLQLLVARKAEFHRLATYHKNPKTLKEEINVPGNYLQLKRIFGQPDTSKVRVPHLIRERQKDSRYAKFRVWLNSPEKEEIEETRRILNEVIDKLKEFATIRSNKTNNQLTPQETADIAAISKTVFDALGTIKRHTMVVGEELQPLVARKAELHELATYYGINHQLTYSEKQKELKKAIRKPGNYPQLKHIFGQRDTSKTTIPHFLRKQQKNSRYEKFRAWIAADQQDVATLLLNLTSKLNEFNTYRTWGPDELVHGQRGKYCEKLSNEVFQELASIQERDELKGEAIQFLVARKEDFHELAKYHSDQEQLRKDILDPKQHHQLKHIFDQVDTSTEWYRLSIRRPSSETTRQEKFNAWLQSNELDVLAADLQTYLQQLGSSSEIKCDTKLLWHRYKKVLEKTSFNPKDVIEKLIVPTIYSTDNLVNGDHQSSLTPMIYNMIEELSRAHALDDNQYQLLQAARRPLADCLETCDELYNSVGEDAKNSEDHSPWKNIFSGGLPKPLNIKKVKDVLRNLDEFLEIYRGTLPEDINKSKGALVTELSEKVFAALEAIITREKITHSQDFRQLVARKAELLEIAKYHSNQKQLREGILDKNKYHLLKQVFAQVDTSTAWYRFSHFRSYSKATRQAQFHLWLRSTEATALSADVTRISTIPEEKFNTALSLLEYRYQELLAKVKGTGPQNNAIKDGLVAELVIISARMAGQIEKLKSDQLKPQFGTTVCKMVEDLFEIRAFNQEELGKLAFASYDLELCLKAANLNTEETKTSDNETSVDSTQGNNLSVSEGSFKTQQTLDSTILPQTLIERLEKPCWKAIFPRGFKQLTETLQGDHVFSNRNARNSHQSEESIVDVRDSFEVDMDRYY